MYSERVERALRTAVEAHEGQFRKSPESVPYVVHPVHVALLAARFDPDEVTLQAALLHDVVEDGDGWSVERVEREFGARVARIVAELSEDKSKTWGERKQDAIDHVPHLSPEAAAIKACDKLHNLRSLQASLGIVDDPAAVWARFRGGRDRTLEMARGLVEALAPRVEPRLGEALRAALEGLEAIA